MTPNTEKFNEIEAAARKQLADAYVKFPQGCDDRQMKRFLKTGPYPEIAYAIARGWDWKKLINQEVNK